MDQESCEEDGQKSGLPRCQPLDSRASSSPIHFSLTRVLLNMVYVLLMVEQQRVLEDFRENGVLDAIRWAYRSATRECLDSYSEAKGHDNALLSFSRYTLFRDRLDRVFACERYAVGADVAAGVDVVHAQLPDSEVDSLPTLAPGLVQRNDLNTSPGWAWGGTRFLLASGPFGKLDRISWVQKSTTKQEVAGQPDERSPSLFDGQPEEEFGGIIELLEGKPLDMDTLVVAHGLQALDGRIELLIGQPKQPSGWHWYFDLLADGRRGGGSQPVPESRPSSSSPPDADVLVKLRTPVSDEKRAGS